MKVYIAGPMTGLPQYNAAAFHAAAEEWRREGWSPITPLDTDSIVWRRHFGRDFDPAVDQCDYGSPLLGEMFAENIKALTDSQHIAMLPGWQKSRGATMEYDMARLLGYPVFDATTFAKWSESAVQEAHRLVHGNRGADYGHPLDDFTRTAGIWTALLGTKLRDGMVIDQGDVWRCMVGIKLSREVNHPKRDNRVDIAGYAETGQMCADEAERRAA